MSAKRKTFISRLLSHPLFLCGASFLLCFLLSLLVFLPLDPLARQLEKAALEQRLQLEIGHISTRLPPGIKLDQLVLGSPQLADHSLKIDQIALQPRWLSLFSQNPALHYQLKAYEGSGQGQVARNGQVRLQLNDLRLRESLQPQLPLELSFLLTSANFAGQLPFAGQNTGSLQFTIDELQVSGMQKLGSGADLLKLGQAQLTAESVGPLVRITTLNIDGPSLRLSGTGSLRLGRTPAGSSLNLGLTLTPQAGLDPLLKDLLSIMKKPQRDGSYRLNIGGTLTSLRIK